MIYIIEFIKYCLNNFHINSLMWSYAWRQILILNPGPKEISSTLRLHFLQGIISSGLAILCLFDYMSEDFTISCVLGYFITDLSNMIINDFYYKVKSYHTFNARIIEYFHHSLCIIVCLLTNKYYKKYCLVDKNPVITLMLAEISTPFLMAWRWTKQKNIILGSLFFISFIGIRTIYQCIFFMPYIFNLCNYIIGYTLIIPYIGLQLVFSYQIINKAIKVFY